MERIDGHQGHIAFRLGRTGDILVPIKHFDRVNGKRYKKLEFKNQTVPEDGMLAQMRSLAPELFGGSRERPAFDVSRR